MELKNKKVVIPVENMFNDLEFWYPFYRFPYKSVRCMSRTHFIPTFAGLTKMVLLCKEH
jgi:hypothetical protein